MTSTTCAVCTAPTPDSARLCRRDTDLLASELARIAGLVDDLHTTQRRASRFTTPQRTSDAGPVPFDDRATRVLTELRASLAHWMTTPPGAADQLAHTVPTAKLAGCCLAGLGLIRHQQHAGDAYRDITGLLNRARSVVDRPIPRRYAGPCGNLMSDGLWCNTSLYAHPDDRGIQCPTCHAYWDIEQRRAWMVERAQDEWVTLAEAANALGPLTGKSAPRETVRSWVKRDRDLVRGYIRREDVGAQDRVDRIVLHRPLADDDESHAQGWTALIRLGDALEVAHRQATTTAARRAS